MTLKLEVYIKNKRINSSRVKILVSIIDVLCKDNLLNTFTSTCGRKKKATVQRLNDCEINKKLSCFVE